MIASAVKEHCQRRQLCPTGMAYIFAFVSAKLASLPASYAESEAHALKFAWQVVEEFHADYAPLAATF